ncbi:AfsR/SARP family transcriptional regulator [Branchiibius hedensis]|uniref:AfsR/SARP family transcriptional regulator n=1 Tax=Branchiibius hedensis TaxID=672460 RepID=UPI001474FDDB|nr:BTAD domain-containing putative transcriptional regulator [Branchiibius hedensis]
MHLKLLDVVAVEDGDRVVSGADLGGRRARVILAVLALNEHAASSDTLARALWADDAPPTWPTALRGAVRALRTALAPVGGDGERVVATVPSGYCLAPGVTVDVTEAEAAVRRAEDLIAQRRFTAARDCAAPVAAVRGTALLPEEDAPWLSPYRVALDDLAVRALQVLAQAATALGDHPASLDAGPPPADGADDTAGFAPPPADEPLALLPPPQAVMVRQVQVRRVTPATRLAAEFLMPSPHQRAVTRQ